jgi:hypothetical protein
MLEQNGIRFDLPTNPELDVFVFPYLVTYKWTFATGRTGNGTFYTVNPTQAQELITHWNDRAIYPKSQFKYEFISAFKMV